jgi:NADH-quinone oxidoreductase subunit N
MNFTVIQQFAEMHPDNTLLRVGFLLILVGLLFKIGVVPFQIWIPDVYQGAPTPVTAYLSVASKTAGLLLLLQLLIGPFASQQQFVTPMLSFMAGATILFGNITALSHRNVKRIMGLSGIAQAGYMLVGVLAAFHVQELAIQGLLLYLSAYLLASYAVFGVMTWNAGEDDAGQTLDDYLDFGKKHPALGFVLVIGLASLAGIPPLAGFIGKFVLFVAAWKAGLTTLLFIAVVGVASSIFYYFGWIQEATFKLWKAKDPTGHEDNQAPETRGIAPIYLWALILITAATVVLGFYQEFLPILGVIGK